MGPITAEVDLAQKGTITGKASGSVEQIVGQHVGMKGSRTCVWKIRKMKIYVLELA